MNLLLSDSTHDGTTVVRVCGELDIETAPVLRSHVLDLVRAGRPVVLDLAELGFIDSSGLQVLLSSHRRAQLVGVSFALRSLTRQVRRLLELTDLLTHFDVAETPVTDLRRKMAVSVSSDGTAVDAGRVRAPLPRPAGGAGAPG